MRVQYVSDINDHGMEMARQMSFLVEQGHDAMFSESYRSARTSFTRKMEVEEAKRLAKDRIEKASGHRGGGRSGATQGE